ncbi:tetratricopeptide repeat-containing sulfotransferase family protein [Fulvimonas yonginensis]
MGEPTFADQAAAAFNRRDWPRARELALRALEQAPLARSGMHYVAGIACLEMQQLVPAIGWLRQAVELHPGRADFAAQLAKALSIARMPGDAVAAADRALALAPADPITLDTLGVVYTQANAHERAIAVFRRAAACMPGAAHYRFNLATSLVFAGDTQGAEQELEACLALDPAFWKAHLTLAQLRHQTRERNHLERLRSLLTEASADPAGAMYLHLALAKEYEDLGDYPAAFDHLVRGKAAGRASRPYAARRDEALFEALMRAFSQPSQEASGFPCEEPIFVIGMPRSGTTLVERILSSHPDVHSAGELQNFGAVLKRLSASPTPYLLDPDTIARARRIAPRHLGEAYVASTRPATGAKPRFVDKLPHNFLYAGFIARALPKARIICLRRDPLDTCLSNFRQLFAQTSPYYDYSFDLLDTGRYYVLFDRLMAHWRRVLPDRILEVRYESLVDDQEAGTRALLQHCGLPWDEACLRFEHNPAPVATASAVQVRSPIYRTAIRRWERYRAQLAPVRELLRHAGLVPEDD